MDIACDISRPRIEHQRIACLMPLDAALRRVEALVLPIPAREAPRGDLLGATLAADIVVEAPRPSRPTALIDGFAGRAEWTADASTYTPAPLAQAVEIDAGKVLPDGFDAVLPRDVLTWRTGVPEAVAEVASGEGVLLPGMDGAAGEVLRRVGERVRATHLAAMAALGIDHARVRRPRIRLAVARKQGGEALDATLAWLCHAIAADGGTPEFSTANLTTLFVNPEADAIVIVGGTGAGVDDHTVQELAKAGRVEFHGVAISPGESVAFGIASVPVLLVPDRIDGALAAWLLIGRAVLGRLRGAKEPPGAPPGDASLADWYGDSEDSCEKPLLAKIVSTIGVTEVVLVTRESSGAAPLAAKYFPLASLARAEGYIVVPAANEGFAPGTRISVRPLP